MIKLQTIDCFAFFCDLNSFLWILKFFCIILKNFIVTSSCDHNIHIGWVEVNSCCEFRVASELKYRIVGFDLEFDWIFFFGRLIRIFHIFDHLIINVHHVCILRLVIPLRFCVCYFTVVSVFEIFVKLLVIVGCGGEHYFTTFF